ncbi:MAG: Phenylalanine--tRNA ligase alpha subunit [Candidatus Doudnabacteria bacterium]|nr:Phenylalanine--tRNA ligase alpha subunit [Candidatus Doudnabacteria bacterium]
MLDTLKKLQNEFEHDLSNIADGSSLQNIKTKYLGRKEGLITLLFEDLKNWSIEKKKEFGGSLNELKRKIEETLAEKEKTLTEKNVFVDLSIPAIKPEVGHMHPISQLQKEIEDIFFGLGFDVQLGPEIESDYYNFEALNIPEDHPARDMQDTFYMDIEHPKKHPGKNIVLRTHISNMQVRYMEKHKPPFSVVLPGRVFRNESLDASHEHTYQYMEGFVVGKNVSYANMAWTLDYVMKEVFGKDVQTKLLPSYFPFVEPAAEGFISCLVCKGKGCSVCKQTGWVEVFGCGMIHQKVLAASGYKQGEYTGFAFGFGLSRLALMKYSIPDIRLFAENDLRFLNQF